jgi:hypothetical protein
MLAATTTVGGLAITLRDTEKNIKAKKLRQVCIVIFKLKTRFSFLILIDYYRQLFKKTIPKDGFDLKKST